MRSAASDPGLHCLPVTLLGVSRLQWVNVQTSQCPYCRISFDMGQWLSLCLALFLQWLLLRLLCQMFYPHNKICKGWPWKYWKHKTKIGVWVSLILPKSPASSLSRTQFSSIIIRMSSMVPRKIEVKTDMMECEETFYDYHMAPNTKGCPW